MLDLGLSKPRGMGERVPSAILCSVQVCPWGPDLSSPLCKVEIVPGFVHLKGIAARVMREVGMKGDSPTQDASWPAVKIQEQLGSV